MRKRRFVQIRVDSWEDTVVLGKGLAGHVFRGQSDAKWSLSTTIERAARRYGFPDGALRNREVVLLNNFQRRAHQYLDDPPSLEDRLEWLALMQHHGAPTRLLDFSHSFYVAAFFSMESAEQDGAIWALSTDFTMGHTSNLLSQTKTMLDLEVESRAVLQAHLSGRQTSTCVMLVEPHRMNARLAVQQGCFVVPGDLSKSFMESLACCLEVDVATLAVKKARSLRPGDADRLFDSPVIKIVLPKEIHNRAVWDLDQMNVNATSLFPGLDGFARSLHTWFRDVI
jgi:FRG domain